MHRHQVRGEQEGVGRAERAAQRLGVHPGMASLKRTADGGGTGNKQLQVLCVCMMCMRYTCKMLVQHKELVGSVLRLAMGSWCQEVLVPGAKVPGGPCARCKGARWSLCQVQRSPPGEVAQGQADAKCPFQCSRVGQSNAPALIADQVSKVCMSSIASVCVCACTYILARMYEQACLPG